MIRLICAWLTSSFINFDFACRAALIKRKLVFDSFIVRLLIIVRKILVGIIRVQWLYSIKEVVLLDHEVTKVFRASHEFCKSLIKVLVVLLLYDVKLI